MGIHGIRELMQEIVAKFDSVKIVEVESVNFPFFVGITPEGDTINDLMLVTEESDNGIYCIPKVGSNVMVAMQNDTRGFIIGYGEIDEVVLRGDQHGGLVKVSELVDKLNNLENKVNTIITTFNTHVHSGVTVGAGVTAVTPTLIVGTLTPTINADIENTLVKHG